MFEKNKIGFSLPSTTEFFSKHPVCFDIKIFLINPVLKVVSSIPLLVLCPILLTYSIFYSMQELSKHWSTPESENYWSEQNPVQGNLKGTVDVISSDPPFVEGHA